MQSSYNELSLGTSPVNELDFVIEQKLNKIQTISICAVTAVNGLTMTVEPMMQSVDGEGKALATPNMYDIPCGCVRGGIAGIITEYEIGDQVIVGFSSRDLSKAKRGQAGIPDTARTFNISDAIILGHFSQNLPSIFIKVTKDGIEIKAPKLTAVVDGDAIVKAKNIVASGNSISLNGQVAIGGDNNENAGEALVMSSATITLNSDCVTSDGKKVTGTAKVTAGFTKRTIAS